MIRSDYKNQNTLRNFSCKFLQQTFAAANKLRDWSKAAAKHAIQIDNFLSELYEWR